MAEENNIDCKVHIIGELDMQKNATLQNNNNNDNNKICIYINRSRQYLYTLT